MDSTQVEESFVIGTKEKLQKYKKLSETSTSQNWKQE